MSGDKWSVPRSFLPVLFAVVAFGSSGSAPASEERAEELLQSYERALEPYRKVTFYAQERDYIIGRQSPKATPDGERNTRVWRDGEKWKLLGSAHTRYPDEKGQPSEFREEGEAVYPDKGLIKVGHKPGEKPTGVLAYLDELPEDQKKYIPGMMFADIITGHVGSNIGVPLTAVLRESSLAVKKGTLEDQEFVILEGTGKWGYHALWLDPKKDYLPRRIVQRKQRNDWAERNKPLSTLQYGEGRLVGIQHTLDITRTDVIGGRHVVTGLTITEEPRVDKGTVHSVRTEITYSEIDLNPDFSRKDPFVITAPIPDGTRVTVHDHPGIEYEWRGGRIVKTIRTDSVAGLAQATFTPGGRWFGWGMVTLGGLALAGLGLLARYRLRQRPSHP